MFEQSSIDLSLYNISFAYSSKLCVSKYPPRKPHSPIIPLETEWSDISSTEFLKGSPNSARTFLNEINGILGL